MMWVPIKLKRYTYTSDELNDNVPNGLEQVMECQGRITPWTEEQIAVQERDVTRNEQQYLLPAAIVPLHVAKQCQIATVDEEDLKITAITEWSPRWICIRVRVYKP